MAEKNRIDLLIIRYLDGNIRPDDLLWLQRWMQTDSHNMQYYTETKKIWDSCYSLGNSPEELEIALKRFRKNFKPAYDHHSQKRRISSYLYRVAAIFIIGIALFGIYQYMSRAGKPSQDMYIQSATNKVIIPKGQKGQLVLSDGTKIWLNSESTLEYPGTFGQEREVTLSGEAYFEVKSDELHPFLVQTHKLKIMVTGTTFNIKAYETDDRIETTLVEGRLSILNNDRELVILQPKESAVYSQKENSMNIMKLDAGALTMVAEKPIRRNRTEEMTPIELVSVWKEDKLIFQDELLGSIVAKLERWFNRKIHVSDPNLLNNEYNGKFVYNETVYQVLDVICRSSADLKYEEVNHEFYISKK